jgi:hypothetical protein
MNKTPDSRFTFKFFTILLFASLMFLGLGFNKNASARNRQASMDAETATITRTLTVTLTPTVTSTWTPTPTSQPGPPALLAPDNGAVLPQPIAPNQWYFAWDARKGPCHCTITIQGPGVQISQNVNYYR